MKISVITIHDIGNNYGSTLQSSALWRYIKNQGYDVEIIDYQPEYRSLKGRIRLLAVNAMFLRNYLIRKKRFDSYFKSNISLTQRFKKYQQLYDNPPQADVYMVGSDQVWNITFPCGHDAAYYLNFVNSPNKMSYASSLGREFNTTQLNALKQKIHGFSFVAVREHFSSEQLAGVGVNANYVLDPVFLLTKDEYLEDATEPPCKRYLLVYAINKEKLLDSAAQRIAAERNLKIVLIGGFAKKIKCDVFYRSAGPKEFLGLIASADFILTSSFHGTAFSMIFNKPFAVVEPTINLLRIDDLLNSTGLTDRVIKKAEDIDVASKLIDYETVNQKLDLLIEQSKQYLIQSLEKFENKFLGSER